MHFNTLVNSTPVAGNLNNEQWLIFDCRFSLDDAERGRREYGIAHIPGAIYAHLDEDLAGPVRKDSGRHPLPGAEEFRVWLGDVGMGNQTQAVVYDDSGGMFAARLWWMLRWLGHEHVALLDGGWQVWNRLGYPVTADMPAPSPKVFTGVPRDNMWVATADMEGEIREQRSKIVDARARPRFTGEKETIDPVAGHIPGAVNYPLSRNLDKNGHFVAPKQLRKLFGDLMQGCEPAEVINMCGSGVTACHNILAMEVAGWPGTRLYAGSWSEWITDPSRPVATGSTS